MDALWQSSVAARSADALAPASLLGRLTRPTSVVAYKHPDRPPYLETTYGIRSGMSRRSRARR